jgi:hypothetical protein
MLPVLIIQLAEQKLGYQKSFKIEGDASGAGEYPTSESTQLQLYMRKGRSIG